MRKSIFLVYVLCVFALPACTTAKKPAGNAITALELSRGACFGKCPVYSVKIFDNGLVRYTGRSFVPFEGIYEKKFPMETVQKLLNEATSYRLDTCKGEYPYVPDLPGIDFTITYKTRTQQIKNAGRGPALLRELASDIDEAIKVDATWKKIADKETDPRNP
jgi:hypothetical protein